MKYKCEEIATCAVCNLDVPPKSRVYFKNMAEELMESLREILAEKYSEEQIVEALGKEPVVCRGKYNRILKKLTKKTIFLIDSSIFDSTNVSEKQLLLFYP